MRMGSSNGFSLSHRLPARLRHMRRREFICGLWSATAVQSAARAQQPSVPVVGFLAAGSPAPLRDQLVAYRGGLRDAGYTEGQTVAIEYRWAEGRYDRLSDLTIELLAKQVSVISATGS